MWNWKNWIWPGFVTVAAIGAGVIWFETELVETDIAGRAGEALVASQPFVKVTADGRDLTLEGAAPSEEARSDAVAVVKSIRGVRVVTNKMDLLPIENPYRLSVDKNSAGIKLQGFVPGVLAHDALKSKLAAELPGIQVTDATELARGAPENFDKLTDFGFRQLGRLGEGGFSIEGDKLALYGSALSADDFDALNDDVETFGTSVSKYDVAPPLISGTYGFRVDVSANGGAVSGYVPSVALREKLLTAATDAANSSLSVASGTPEAVDWEQASMAAVRAAENLSRGHVSIVGDTLNLEGDARDGAAFKALQSMMTGEIPGGLKRGSIDIGLATVDPFEWNAKIDGDELQLQGYLPSEAFRKELLSQANANFGNIRVIEEMSLANGAPEGFEAAAKAALLALSRMESGEVKLKGSDVAVSGKTFGANGQSAVQSFLASGLPEGFSGSGQVSLVSAPADDPSLQLEIDPCQAMLSELGERNTVLFETGSAKIQPDSYGFLDRMIHTVSRCTDIKIEIAGHTDSDGSEEQNLTLSESRADAVSAYLVEGGIEANRLVAVGYGESQPKAANDTQEGKAKNRRIELQVLR